MSKLAPLSRRDALFAMACSLGFLSAGCSRKFPDGKFSAHAARAQEVPGNLPRETEALRPGVIETVQIGAHSAEAMMRAGIGSRSTVGLDDAALYGHYRKSVRQLYGADLADMNYFSVGSPGWETRIASLERWLVRAAAFGDPTLAIEPHGRQGYSLFCDSPALRRLCLMFRRLQERGVTVWVRFASECNLKGSDFSVYGSTVRQRQFRDSARWFREFTGAKIVCSPLINTAFLAHRTGERRQIRTLEEMLKPGLWDRIGGTLYASSPRSFGTLDEMFAWYHDFARQQDAVSPFQICELGGPSTQAERREGMLNFMADVAAQRWDSVEKINLFAGPVNGRLQREHGLYGFIAPGENESYLKDRFWPG